MLQYVCPVGILIYSCIKDRVAPTLGEIVSIIFAIGGTFLIATHGQLDQLSMTPAGLFWGLFSALTYALYIILPIALIKSGEQLGHWCGDGHSRFGRPSFTGFYRPISRLVLIFSLRLQALSLSGLSLPIQLSLKEPV